MTWGVTVEYTPKEYFEHGCKVTLTVHDILDSGSDERTLPDVISQLISKVMNKAFCICCITIYSLDDEVMKEKFCDKIDYDHDICWEPEEEVEVEEDEGS